MTDGVTIYLSEPDEAIERLARLDSARRPSGPVLADPFQQTAALVSLLELRVAQMRARPNPGRLASGAQGVRAGTRRRDDCRAFVLPNVHELPLRLERVIADSFGGLVGSNAASCVTTTAINHHPRGDLS